MHGLPREIDKVFREKRVAYMAGLPRSITPNVTVTGECGIVFNAESKSLMLNIPLNVQLPLKSVVELLLKLDKDMANGPLKSDSCDSTHFDDQSGSLQRIDAMTRWPIDSAMYLRRGSYDAHSQQQSRLSADAPVFTPTIVSTGPSDTSVTAQPGDAKCNQM